MTGPELRAWRQHWGLTQHGLGCLLGVTKLSVSRWENAHADIPSMLPLALETLERRQAAELRARADQAERETAA